ncbi:hypothetical protein ACWGPD_09440 [Streptomyces hirsutus]|uniref:hypothetical protein n=1 Tax=Streptomyces hirsutus TaxID=35620 RepID=UPI003318CB4C
MAYLFDTVVNGQGSAVGKAFFFKDSRYIIYDWATGGATGTPASLTAWGLGAPFDTGVDAALNGAGPSQNLAFFIRGDRYMSYSWLTSQVRGPYSLTTWNLPAGFASGVDAAITGQGAQSGKAYFFRGNQYVARDWSTGQTSGPSPLSGFRLTGRFLRGLHACLNGERQFVGSTFFFRGTAFLRYEWATEAVAGPLHNAFWKLSGGIGS